ncbi:phenylacetate--CoA ligase PaaK [Haloarchaeobius sp. DFWS5]|uniref:phenylacetate--CoA ligase PaaK n=1 Tax=Haloarchaeobius sp. DFWS5 TaxID=3446114 RepID=UPI003EBA4F3C
MVYNDIETASREQLTEVQTERLRDTVEHVYENVPWYREQFEEAGITPEDVESVDDISKLPFTTKEDIRDNYPDDLFAVGHEDLLRVHASSGTTGKPKIVGYTEGDLGVWREVMARSLAAAGVDSDMMVQNAYGYGLFTGGLGFHDGIEELGAAVIPTGGGNTARQISMLQDMESDVLCCTPSYCLYLAERAEEMGIDVRDLSLSRVVIGAEPFTDPMREEIEEALGVTAVDVYGLSEIIGPGVSIECAEAQDGLHIWEDHFYPEAVDPVTGDPVEPGEEGELVLTSITKEAFPMIRYRTGDMTRLHYETCECGRTAVRMDNVTGRSDDLLIVRGVNVYPSQVEEVMLDMEAVAPYYRIDLYREGNLDTMELTVEHHEDYDGTHDDLEADIESKLLDVLEVKPDEVEVVGPGVIERTEVGKVKRVFDHRDE